MLPMAKAAVVTALPKVRLPAPLSRRPPVPVTTALIAWLPPTTLTKQSTTVSLTVRVWLALVIVVFTAPLKVNPPTVRLAAPRSTAPVELRFPKIA